MLAMRMCQKEAVFYFVSYPAEDLLRRAWKRSAADSAGRQVSNSELAGLRAPKSAMRRHHTARRR